MIGNVSIRVAEVDAIGVQRRTQRAAGIAGRRRNEHALEPGLGQDPRVRDAVQRHAAGETQIRQTALMAEPPRDVQQRVLEHPLHAGRAVGEALPLRGLQIDRIVRVARRSEQIDELRGIRSTRRRLELEVLRRQRERAVRGRPDQLPDVVRHDGPPVGGEPHHLVLVLVDRKSEVRGERGIQHPERMREPDLAVESDVGAAVGAALAAADRERGPLADAVSREDGRAEGRRRHERGRRMRRVVIGEEDLPARHPEVR